MGLWEETRVPTKKGLAVWGISLGDDFAMSEDPYRIVSSEQGDDYLVLGDQKIDFEHDYEKRFMMDEIINSRETLRFDKPYHSLPKDCRQ